MAKKPRVFQKVFAESSGLNQVGKFGSLAAGANAYTSDPAVIQSLSQFTGGWFSAVLGNNSPAIEDMNALFLLLTYQFSYLFQQGIPEWDSQTVYYKNSMVNYLGTIYVSLEDDNVNSNPSTPTKWGLYGNSVKTVTGGDDYQLLPTDDVVRIVGTPVVFLPLVAEVPIGKEYKIKNKTEFSVMVIGENIDDDGPDFTLTIRNQSAIFINNGVSWDIF